MMDRVHDLAGIDSLKVDRGDTKVGMPELALDDRQWDPFVRHLDRMSVPELMGREPPPHPRLRRKPAKLTTSSGR